MTDLVFNILDELYFICSFDDIIRQTQIENNVLKHELWLMIENGLVRTLENEEEINISLADFTSNFKKYHYIATKKGLMAHNTI